MLRFTKDIDVLSKEGQRRLFHACKTEPYPMLCGAIPCTGGSPWQHINVLRGAGDKIAKHQELAKKMWQVFARAGHIVRARGGVVAFHNSSWGL